MRRVRKPASKLIRFLVKVSKVSRRYFWRQKRLQIIKPAMQSDAHGAETSMITPANTEDTFEDSPSRYGEPPHKKLKDQNGSPLPLPVQPTSEEQASEKDATGIMENGNKRSSEIMAENTPAQSPQLDAQVSSVGEKEKDKENRDEGEDNSKGISKQMSSITDLHIDSTGISPSTPPIDAEEKTNVPDKHSDEPNEPVNQSNDDSQDATPRRIATESEVLPAKNEDTQRTTGSPIPPAEPNRSEEQAESRDKEAKVGSKVSGDGHVCANCKVTKTPLWRRGLNGQVLCNACGLYLKARNINRPVSLQRMPQVRKVVISRAHGSCPGDGRCNGTGGSESCSKCPSFINNNRRNGNLQQESESEEANVKMISCQNCGTVTTPLWRRDSQGHIICNACGLYSKLHNFTRPTASQSYIKRRKRGGSKNGPEDGSKAESDTEIHRSPNSSDNSQTSPLDSHNQIHNHPPGQFRSPIASQAISARASPDQSPPSQLYAQAPQQYQIPIYDPHVGPLNHANQINMGYQFQYIPVPPPVGLPNVPSGPSFQQHIQPAGPSTIVAGAPVAHSQMPPISQMPHGHIPPPQVPLSSQEQNNSNPSGSNPIVPSQNVTGGQGSGGLASQGVQPQQATTPSPQAAHLANSRVSSNVDSPASGDPNPEKPPSLPLLSNDNNLNSSPKGKRKSWDESNDSPLSVLKYLNGASKDTIKEYLLAAQRQLNDKVTQLRRNLEKAEYQLSECENYLKSVNNNEALN